MAKRVYSDEFKQAAVEQVIVGRHTMVEVFKRLGINYQTLRQWVDDARLASPVSTVPKELPIEQRYRELEKENARLRMERDIFWGKLKTEMVNHAKFETKREAQRAIFEYIEMFYNRKRLHATLNYVSPVEFEEGCVR